MALLACPYVCPTTVLRMPRSREERWRGLIVWGSAWVTYCASQYKPLYLLFTVAPVNLCRKKKWFLEGWWCDSWSMVREEVSSVCFFHQTSASFIWSFPLGVGELVNNDSLYTSTVLLVMLSALNVFPLAYLPSMLWSPCAGAISQVCSSFWLCLFLFLCSSWWDGAKRSSCPKPGKVGNDAASLSRSHRLRSFKAGHKLVQANDVGQINRSIKKKSHLLCQCPTWSEFCGYAVLFSTKMGIYENECLVEQFIWVPEGGITDFAKSILIARSMQDATKFIFNAGGQILI